MSDTEYGAALKLGKKQYQDAAARPGTATQKESKEY